MDSSITESATKRIALIQSHLVPEETKATTTQPQRNVNICPATGYDKNKVWPRILEQDKPIRVLVTGAAGNIAYSLLFMIANGGLFGSRQPIILHLLDIPAAGDALKGVHMELVDGSFPTLRDIVATTDVRTAFSGVDVAILVGAFPRQKGMERKDLLKKNCAIFKEQGKALNDYASKDVKVVVVGNPANTNCAIAQANAPDLPPQNFTALTRLDHNRAKAQIALKLKVPVKSVKNVIIWGNHSATQYPDVNFGVIEDYPSKGFQSNIRSLVNDDKWVQNEFLTTVQQRGAAIIQARKLSSAASAAHAVIGHLKDWLFGTVNGEFVSMAVVSDGSYGVPKDIVFSYPVTCSQGKWNIVQNLPWDDFSKKKIDATTTELLEEKTEAFSFLG